MKPDRSPLSFFVLTLIGILICALVAFFDPLLFLFRKGMALILAMPQRLWWFVGVGGFTVWGFCLLVHLGKKALSGREEPRPVLQPQGDLSQLCKFLEEARSGPYYQDRVRQRLSNLAVDLISLRLDLSEEEARKVYFREDWTEDELVRAYFFKGKENPLKNERSRSRDVRRLGPSLFLKETDQILDRLSHYYHAPNGGEIGYSDDNHQPGIGKGKENSG